MQRTNFKPHYLIVSNMRSGSSAVSRVMHEKMGIVMFLNPPKSDEFNPKGYYEDVEITNMNELTIRGNTNVLQLIDYLKIYTSNIQGSWGLKDGRIALLGVVYKHVFPNARIIRLHRNENDIVKSMVKKYGFTEENARLRIFTTNMYIDSIWGNNIWAYLDMTEQRSDKEIKNAIRERTREI